MNTRELLKLPSGMKKFTWLWAVMLACLGGCMDSPENGTVVDENAVVRFSGYSPSGDVTLQVETASGWQTVASAHTQDQFLTNAFDDQTYDLFPWSIDSVVPSAGWRRITGRDGTSFRGARLRMVIYGEQAYTVKPGATACWSANRATLNGWVAQCTPATDNKVLELRSTYQPPPAPVEPPGCPAGTHQDCAFDPVLHRVVCECV